MDIIILAAAPPLRLYYGWADALLAGGFMMRGCSILIFLSVGIAVFGVPVQARFLQTDPVGYSADPNLYVYVANDPTNRTDPTGLLPDESPVWDNLAAADHQFAVQHPSAAAAVGVSSAALLLTPIAVAIGGPRGGAVTLGAATSAIITASKGENAREVWNAGGRGAAASLGGALGAPQGPIAAFVGAASFTGIYDQTTTGKADPFAAGAAGFGAMAGTFVPGAAQAESQGVLPAVGSLLTRRAVSSAVSEGVSAVRPQNHSQHVCTGSRLPTTQSCP